MTYGEGIAEVNRMIFRILDTVDPENERLVKIKQLNPNFLSEMLVEPVFAYGFPKDKMDELQRAQLELNMKLGSRREIMERMGKQNIPELLQEIDDDTVQQALLQVEINEMVAGGNPEESTEAPSLETEDISGNEESVSSGEMTE